jgi:RNA ligase
MTNLKELLDLDLLETEIADGYVKRQYHPTQPLAILNYTAAAQYAQRWNDVTEQCRGLIYDTETLEVVARPWRKFHNWDQSGKPYPPVGPMIMSTKFDGSLGILYWPDDDRTFPSIATRGSFTSDQAEFGTRLLSNICRTFNGDTQRWLIGEWSNPSYTYLFEIIYPANRIVVNYGGDCRLVLLDVINNETGRQDVDRFEASIWYDKAEKTLVPDGFSHSIVEQIPPGEEGFVLSWPTRGFMCKMKSAEYVELHRIVTGLSKKAVWEAVGAGKAHELRANVPDELYGWFDETVAEIHDAIAAILDQASDDEQLVRDAVFSNLTDSVDSRVFRRLFAAEAACFPETRAYLFKMLDGASPEALWKMAWKSVKPVGDTHAWNQSEDVA